MTSAISNSRKVWNKDKCQCKCKEDLIDKLVCDKGYIWNSSTFACECDKLCDFGLYLGYKSCVCRKSLIKKLVEECVSAADADVMYNKTTSAGFLDDCPSRKPYIVLFAVFLSMILIIGGVFNYFYWYKNSHIKNNVYNVNYSISGTQEY